MKVWLRAAIPAAHALRDCHRAHLSRRSTRLARLPFRLLPRCLLELLRLRLTPPLSTCHPSEDICGVGCFGCCCLGDSLAQPHRQRPALLMVFHLILDERGDAVWGLRLPPLVLPLRQQCVPRRRHLRRRCACSLARCCVRVVERLCACGLLGWRLGGVCTLRRRTLRRRRWRPVRDVALVDQPPLDGHPLAQRCEE